MTASTPALIFESRLLMPKPKNQRDHTCIFVGIILRDERFQDRLRCRETTALERIHREFFVPPEPEEFGAEITWTEVVNGTIQEVVST